MRYAYPCILTPEPEGGFMVQFPDIPGAATCGDDLPEALEMAEDGLTVILCAYVENDADLPKPSPAAAGQQMVALPLLVAAKLSLYAAMRERGITRTQLAATLDITESAVRNLLTLDHDSPITTVMCALHAVGRRLVVEDLAA